MTELRWNRSDSRTMLAGVDRGVFFPPGRSGVVWNGLVSVQETPSSVRPKVRYIDGKKIPTASTYESYSGEIEAITYPSEFEPYDGVDTKYGFQGQLRLPFGLSFRTREIDGNGNEIYTIHIVYNLLVSPSGANRRSLGASVGLERFRWGFTTLPTHVPGANGTAHIQLKSTNTHEWTFEAVERILYGTTDTDPRLPTPSEIVTLIEANAVIRIIDHGDGSWTAVGPDDLIRKIDNTSFEIDSPTAVYISENTYTIRSW